MPTTFSSFTLSPTLEPVDEPLVYEDPTPSLIEDDPIESLYPGTENETTTSSPGSSLLTSDANGNYLDLGDWSPEAEPEPEPETEIESEPQPTTSVTDTPLSGSGGDSDTNSSTDQTSADSSNNDVSSSSEPTNEPIEETQNPEEPAPTNTMPSEAPQITTSETVSVPVADTQMPSVFEEQGETDLASGPIDAELPSSPGQEDPVDDFLPGDAAYSYGSAQLGLTAFGNIESEGDRDRFEISLQTGMRYNISLERDIGSSGSTPNAEIIKIFSITGTRVQSVAVDDGPADTNVLVSGLTVEADGFYQIEVSGAVGPYGLTVTSAGYIDDYLPGISSGLGSVTIDGPATGEIEEAGDTDAFTVFLDAGTTYKLTSLGNSSNNGTLGDPSIVAVSLDGEVATFFQAFEDGGVGRDSVAYFSPTTSAEYVIEVAGARDSIGSYTLAVEDAGFLDDFSADRDTEGFIAPGSSVNGQIHYSGDADWFETNLEVGRLYRIELISSEGVTPLTDPFFNGIYGPLGQMIENTSNDDGGVGTNSAIDFIASESGTYYLSAGGFNDNVGTYRLELTDLGPLDDDDFDITLSFGSGDYADAYTEAFERAAERWEEVLIGDLPYALVDGVGFVDDILIDVVFSEIDLTFEGVEQQIIAISSVLDQRQDNLETGSLLPTHSRIIVNSDEADRVFHNLDELAANTIGRALGFGSLWEELGLLREFDGMLEYTGANGLREIAEISNRLTGSNILEEGSDGGLAGEYWSEALLDAELMTPRIEFRGPNSPPRPPDKPDNPLSALTVAAMHDLGYAVSYDNADPFSVSSANFIRTAANARSQTQDLAPETSDGMNGLSFPVIGISEAGIDL